MCYIFYFARLTLLTIWLTPVHSVSPVMVFSRQLPGRVFVTLPTASVQACVRECDVRPSCRSVNYRRASTECQLNNDSDDNVALIETPGSVYVRKSASPTPCGAVTCTSGQVCLTASSACDVKECPRPPLENSIVLGNMRDIGSRVYLSCSPTHVMQIDNDWHRDNIVSWQCQLGGNWSGPNITCLYFTDACTDYLVSGDHRIDDSAITATTYWELNDDLSPRQGRITTPAPWAWVADLSDPAPYIQAQFPSVKLVTGVVTLGRDGTQYVTAYSVYYSKDCTYYNGVTDNGVIKIFPGNDASQQLVTNHLPLPVKALCVRVVRTSATQVTAMRFDIIGCH